VSDFDRLALKLSKLRADLDGPQLLRDAAKDLVPLVGAAVRADLGDLSMSHWRRSNPIEIVGMVDELATGGVEIAPARKARGPMRVLESGRKAYAAGDRRVSGTRVRQRDGVVVAKTRRVKRTTGAAGGRGTWSDADEMIRERAPAALNAQKVAALGRYFTKVG